MAFNQRLIADALCDMQRAMAVFEQPFFQSFFDQRAVEPKHHKKDNHRGLVSRFPATDMVEKPDLYELHAEIPGYDKKDLKIEVPDDHTLILSGSVKKERHECPAEDKTSNVKEQQQQQVVHKKEQDSQMTRHTSSPKWWVNERMTGAFSRTFSFPESIDAERIKASSEDGILKVIIPKANKNSSRFIQID
ncbi:heat shock protein [Choanephora cucurbitarum]|uniref:Heat shock protein n=1 Tax=Choanephora cucurbitarum TaxID=101091 RepID=A0A1C7NKW3_9FUNG|nr:heat shock protein [Choanephora cucurbitarum]